MLPGSCRVCTGTMLLCALNAAAICQDGSCELPEDMTALLQQSAQLGPRRSESSFEEDEWESESMDEGTGSGINVIPHVPLHTQMSYAPSKKQAGMDMYPQILAENDDDEDDDEWTSDPLEASSGEFPAGGASLTQVMPSMTSILQEAQNKVTNKHGHSRKGVASGMTSSASRVRTSSQKRTSSGLEKLNEAIAQKEAGKIVQNAAGEAAEKAAQAKQDTVAQHIKDQDTAQVPLAKASVKESPAEVLSEKDMSENALNRLDNMLQTAAAKAEETKLDKILSILSSPAKQEEKVTTRKEPEMSGLTVAALYDMKRRMIKGDAEKKVNAMETEDPEGFEELMNIIASSKADDPKSTHERVRQALDKSKNTVFASSSSESSAFDELLRKIAAGKEQSGMKIFIKAFTGRTIPLNVESADSIETVKSKIHTAEGIPSDTQMLYFNGRELDNDHSLRDYQVGKDATLHLVKSESVHSINDLSSAIVQNDSDDVSKILQSITSAQDRAQAPPTILTESMSQKLSQIIKQNIRQDLQEVNPATPTQAQGKQPSEKMNKLLGALDQFLRGSGIGHITLS